MAKKAQKAQLTERNYNVIVAPHITEKATLVLENNVVTFKVTIDATKPEIKTAIEGLWGVKVKAVNTVVTKGKTKRFKGVMGKRSDFKKAYVTLEDGQSIDISAGV
tara:strand:- start:247565 stop:247882 length:318 start_codon:yes stop_codon:yes gene_type:complete